MFIVRYIFGSVLVRYIVMFIQVYNVDYPNVYRKVYWSLLVFPELQLALFYLNESRHSRRFQVHIFIIFIISNR